MQRFSELCFVRVKNKALFCYVKIISFRIQFEKYRSIRFKLGKYYSFMVTVSAINALNVAQSL